MKTSTECKDCRVCQPNFIACYKSQNEWIYPSDFKCAWGIRFFPVSGNSCPYYIPGFEPERDLPNDPLNG